MIRYRISSLETRRARASTTGRRLGSILFLAFVLAGCGRDAPRVRIVLISIDTLRHDSLELMPETRSFAEDGLLFRNFFAATSTTQPTHASLLTGLHPWEHGVTRNGQVLGEDEESLAEILRGEGYATAAVVASFPLERRFGFAQGFDEFQDTFTVPYTNIWAGEELEDGRFYSLADSVTRAAVTELERAEGERQFFWFHYFDPHDPYGDTEGRMVPMGQLLAAVKRVDGTAPRLMKQARELYDRDVAVLDRSLGRLFDRLVEDADEYETHVLLTADHGESFGESNCIGHGHRLTAEQIRVPLVIASPRVEARSRGERLDVAGTIDVTATILAIADLDPRGGGRDLTRTPRANEGVAFGMRRSFETEVTQLLLDGSRIPLGGPRFFAVEDGVLYTGDSERLFENDNLEAAVADGLGGRLRLLFESFERRLEGSEVTEVLDADTQEALRALGYIR